MSSLDNDTLILHEYSAWVESQLLGDPDTSPDAYLRAREGEHNGRRIADALKLIPEDLDDLPLEPGRLRDLIVLYRDALIDDRDYIITSSLTGPTERTFT